jgi:hypothetical protein
MTTSKVIMINQDDIIDGVVIMVVIMNLNPQWKRHNRKESLTTNRKVTSISWIQKISQALQKIIGQQCLHFLRSMKSEKEHNSIAIHCIILLFLMMMVMIEMMVSLWDFPCSRW